MPRLPTAAIPGGRHWDARQFLSAKNCSTGRARPHSRIGRRQYLVGDALFTVIVRPAIDGYEYDGRRGRMQILVSNPCAEPPDNGVACRRLFHAETGSCISVWRVVPSCCGGSVRRNGEEDRRWRVTAPMHGMLVEVLVNEGDRVNKGDKLAILEAMKMQHERRASTAESCP